MLKKPYQKNMILQTMKTPEGLFVLFVKYFISVNWYNIKQFSYSKKLHILRKLVWRTVDLITMKL